MRDCRLVALRDGSHDDHRTVAFGAKRKRTHTWIDRLGHGSFDPHRPTPSERVLAPVRRPWQAWYPSNCDWRSLRLWEDRTRRRDFVTGIAGPAVAWPLAAHAGRWPTQVVRIVCPLAAGGGIDATARIVAARLGTNRSSSRTSPAPAATLRPNSLLPDLALPRPLHDRILGIGVACTA